MHNELAPTRPTHVQHIIKNSLRKGGRALEQDAGRGKLLLFSGMGSP